MECHQLKTEIKAQQQSRKSINESHGIELLSLSIRKQVFKWPSKKLVRQEMDELPGIGDVLNDSRLIAEDLDNWWTRIAPDAYFIQKHGDKSIFDWKPNAHHLCFVEIENTSPMTEIKIQRFGMMWDVINSMSLVWAFHLIVVDRYDQWREMDLKCFYDRSYSELGILS